MVGNSGYAWAATSRFCRTPNPNYSRSVPRAAGSYRRGGIPIERWPRLSDDRSPRAGCPSRARAPVSGALAWAAKRASGLPTGPPLRRTADFAPPHRVRETRVAQPRPVSRLRQGGYQGDADRSDVYVVSVGGRKHAG